MIQGGQPSSEQYWRLKLWAEGEGLKDFLTVNEKRAGRRRRRRRDEADTAVLKLGRGWDCRRRHDIVDRHH
jgi:hypothetical protein